MRKRDVLKYKFKKGIGQISFDLVLTYIFFMLDLSFDRKGMAIYSTLKGSAYLLWDILIFQSEVDETETTNKSDE